MRHDDFANDKTGQSGVRGRTLAGKSKSDNAPKEKQVKGKARDSGNVAQWDASFSLSCLVGEALA